MSGGVRQALLDAPGVYRRSVAVAPRDQECGKGFYLTRLPECHTTVPTPTTPHLATLSPPYTNRHSGASVCLFALFVLVLHYTNIFQLYNGGDMMYEMRRRTPKATLLPTQGIFSLPHDIGIV